MEEQFNKEATEGWRFAADAARITDERASDEDRKHTSGGVCPEDFEKSLWFQRQLMHVAPKEPTCKWIEITCDGVITCHSLR